MDTVKNLLLFIKNPSLVRGEVSWKELKHLFVLKLFFVLIFIGVSEFLNLGIEDLTDDYDIMEHGEIILLIFGVIVLPLYEEFLFRLWLDRRKRNLLLSIILCLLWIFAFDNYYNKRNILFFLYLILLLGAFVRGEKEVLSTKFFFFGSAIFFALAHIFNFDFEGVAFKDYFKMIIFPSIYRWSYIRIH